MANNKDDAVRAAIFTVGIPGACFVWFMLVVAFTNRRSLTQLLTNTLIILSVATPIVVVITVLSGCTIGWFANYWFRDTKIAPDQMATVIALIFDCTIASWIVFFF